MANPIRLETLALLLEGEASVSRIITHIGMSQSAVSQHLAKLRRERLVRTRRDAQTIYYSLSSSAVRTLLQVLDTIDPSSSK
ncbi:metalloregulator ArsR/SmtB family transcription factor [Rhizobium sp. SYY.PMSO]|uniref:ArsR/SmtB family transcription factor n=1 Tax=Rhizobium sp. SYY.PMSO TaxID=3382192 RepID=UPI000DDD4B73